MSAGDDIARHRAVLARIEEGQPIRVVVGHYLFDAIGIILKPEYQARLRADIAAGLRELIAELETPPAGPEAPAAGGTAPPFVLPDISPSRGEMGSVAVASTGGSV